MYGLVNQAVQELVVTNFGADKWEAIKRKAGVGVGAFERMETYPDDMTYKMVGAASEVLDLPPDAVMKAFGEFWVLYTGKHGYGHLFDIAGNSLRDFLFNLDNLHTRVGQSFPKLSPPSFRFDAVDEDTVRMHYHTNRPGLCPMVVGLLNGLAKRFETELTVDHQICSRQGAPHCEFVLTLASNLRCPSGPPPRAYGLGGTTAHILRPRAEKRRRSSSACSRKQTPTLRSTTLSCSASPPSRSRSGSSPPSPRNTTCTRGSSPGTWRR
jgi:hypothetical protein